MIWCAAGPGRGTGPASCHDGRMAADVSQLARPRRGHFDLGTGYHGDLWLDLDGLFLWPARIRPYARQLADYLRPYRPGSVCGPLAGGAFLAQLVADVLDVAFLPAYPGPGPPFRPPDGYHLPAAVRDRIGGWRVAVVDDAVSAGTAVQASCDEIRDAGAVPVAVAALMALGPAGAFVTGTLRMPFHAVATVSSQVWPAGGCPLCASGLPLDRPPA
jgi:orotate phosphoribosyltransferase